MTKAERARELFLEGCNCAQAVFLAFAEEKLDRETALKIASGFGGGMAGMRDVCGAGQRQQRQPHALRHGPD